MQLCYKSNSKFESLLFPEVEEDWNDRLQVNINTIPQIEEKVSENILSPDLSLLVKENIVDMQLMHENPGRTESNFESVVNLNLPTNLRYNSAFRNEDCHQNQSVLRHSSEFKTNYIQDNYQNYNTCPNYNKSDFSLAKSKEYFYDKKLSQIDENINSEYQCITSTHKNDHCVYNTEPCTFNQDKEFDFHPVNQNINVEEIKILNSVDSIIEFPKVACDNKTTNNSSESKKTAGTTQNVKSAHKPFPCSYCEKTFMRKENLKSHLAIHTKIRPFVCDICNKSFVQRWDLTCHKRVHTNLYQCSFCSKTFSFKSKLERHIRTHTNDRPFVCTFNNCSKKFSDKRNLIAHNITHLDDKKFTCDKCKKMFKTKKQLNQHSKVHSDCLVHKCDLCLKAYKYKTNLVMHLKKHNGYTCKICQQDFLKLSVLLKHKKDCKNKS